MHSINWWNQNHLGAPRGLQLVSRKVKNFTYAFSKKVPLSNTFFIVRLRNSHNDECHKLMKSEMLGYKCRGGGTPGGTDLEKGYGDVRPWRPPFHATPVVRKGPISSKRVNSQDPLMRKFGNFSLYSLNFCQNFSSQAPNLEIFSSQAPKFGKFSVHKPPNLEIFSSQAPSFRGKYQFASPTLRKSGPHTPTWKKLSAPPPEAELHICKMHRDVTSKWVDFTQKIGKGWSHFDPPPKRISKHGSNG